MKEFFVHKDAEQRTEHTYEDKMQKRMLKELLPTPGCQYIWRGSQHWQFLFHDEARMFFLPFEKHYKGLSKSSQVWHNYQNKGTDHNARFLHSSVTVTRAQPNFDIKAVLQQKSRKHWIKRTAAHYNTCILNCEYSKMQYLCLTSHCKNCGPSKMNWKKRHALRPSFNSGDV